MGILIRVLIQKNVKLQIVADLEENGPTDRGRGWTDARPTDSKTDTAAVMMIDE